MSSSETSSDQVRPWLALAILAVTQFMVMLDQTVVTIATPTIGDDLGLGDASLSWITNAYVLTFGGFLLLGGRIVDLFGHRRTLLAGLVLFTTASLVGGFAGTSAVLLTTRALQGLGAAVLAPAALASVAGLFPAGPERSRAMGIWAAAAGSGASLGVLVGGLLTSGPGWPWIFWVNVPVGIVGMIVIPRALPADRSGGSGRLDIAGALAVTPAIAGLIYGITEAERYSWGSARTITTLAVAAVLLGIFLVIERRVRDPLLDLTLLRNRSVATSAIAMTLFAMAAFAAMFLLSLYFQEVRELDPLEAGLAFLPMSVGVLIGPLGSWVLNRYGPRVTLTIGLLALTAALAWWAQSSPDTPLWLVVVVPSLLVAIGGQFSIVALTVTGVHDVHEDAYGVTSGILSTARELGGAVGVAIFATLAFTVADNSDPTTSRAGALSRGFDISFYGAAVAALLALAVVLLRVPRQTAPGDPTTPAASPPTTDIASVHTV